MNLKNKAVCYTRNLQYLTELHNEFLLHNGTRMRVETTWFKSYLFKYSLFIALWLIYMNNKLISLNFNYEHLLCVILGNIGFQVRHMSLVSSLTTVRP